MAPMNGLPYYKRYPRDFIEGTIGMPFDLKGAYSMVLDLIYMQGGELPDDARYISGLLGCSSKQWTYFRKALIERGKLEVRGDVLVNNRAHYECELTENLRRTQRDNRANRTSYPSKNNDIPLTTVQPKPNHTESDTDTEKKEEIPLTPQPLAVVRQAAPSALVGEFDRIWPHYPRRVGVGSARKAWVQARAKASFEEIAASLRVFIPAVKGTPIDKIPHFATWLNGERWKDDHSHAANRGRTSTDDLQGLSTITATDDLARLMGPQLRALP
jgi:uncharacterized protein YdaU (DUF1376 family)